MLTITRETKSLDAQSYMGTRIPLQRARPEGLGANRLEGNILPSSAQSLRQKSMSSQGKSVVRRDWRDSVQLKETVADAEGVQSYSCTGTSPPVPSNPSVSNLARLRSHVIPATASTSANGRWQPTLSKPSTGA